MDAVKQMPMPQYKQRDTLSHCLASCYSADNPLEALHDYLRDLRRNPEWTREEVDQLEAKATGILSRIVTPQEPA